MTLLRSIADVLRSHGTPFALIGAGAMAVHGVSRATSDLDLLVVDPTCLEVSYWDQLSPRVQLIARRGDADDPVTGLVRVRTETEGPIDIVVGKAPWHRGAVAAAEAGLVEDTEIPVVRRADLVLLKLYAGGPQDMWDIEQLLESAGPEDVRAEIDRRVAELPEDSRVLWQRVRRAS